MPLLWGEGGSVGQGSGWMEELWLAALNNQSMMSLTAAHCLDYTLHISPLSSSLSIIHARSERRKKKKGLLRAAIYCLCVLFPQS